MSSMRELIQRCKTPDEFLQMFRELGVTDGQWRNSKWLSDVSARPSEEGGIGQSLRGLLEGIRKDQRFGTFKQFVAFMDQLPPLDTPDEAEFYLRREAERLGVSLVELLLQIERFAPESPILQHARTRYGRQSG